MPALLTRTHHEDRMIRTPPRPVDIAAVFPELAGRERPTVRLHPRRGRPGPRDSSVGGPLLWPAAEPWPRCDAADRHVTIAPVGYGDWWALTEQERERILAADPRALKRLTTDPRHPDTPMVAVAQLFARDVAGLPWPAGTDTCQVLWCPRTHEPDYGPRVGVRWRASADAPGRGGDLVVAPPSPSDSDVEDEWIPKPCSVSPERTVDYPGWWELTKELRERIKVWERDSGWRYGPHLGAAPGTKVGGWPKWIQDPEWPTCPRGHAMDHLLTVASWEWDAGSWRTWLPSDQTYDGWYVRGGEVHPGISDAGLMLGDAGDVYVSTCVSCDDRPAASVLQCS
jgi:hypothetical protein